MNASRNSFDRAPARIQRLARLPVFFALIGKRALVAGGSAAAAWKAELLSAAGAAVEVYSSELCQELRALAVKPPGGLIALHSRDWTPDDFAGVSMAVGACEDDDAAVAFSVAARKAGVPVNVIDRPAFCDFSFGAIVNRSPLVIGISTDGAAPVFAQAIRARLEAMLPAGLALWAAAASRWRARLKATSLSFAARRGFWHLFTARALAAPERAPAENDFSELVSDIRAMGPATERGSVTTVEADAEDPGRLTLRTLRALQIADVLVYDDMICDAVLDFTRREARRIPVGQAGLDDVCAREAAAGKRVVRLKSMFSSEMGTGSREDNAPNETISAAPAAPRGRQSRPALAAEPLS